MFNTKLQNKMRHNNTSFIDVREFTRILTETFPQVTANEQQVLTAKYARPNDPNSFNFMDFNNDLYQLAQKQTGD